MRFGLSFVTLAAFGSEIAQHGGDVGVTMKSLIGDLSPIEDFARWQESNRLLAKGVSRTYEDSVLYNEVRQPNHCVFPLDIVILQDLTDSFSDNIDEMRNVQLKQMVNGLSASHPGSRFAVIGFQDKPIWKMGNRDDACWRFTGDFTSDFETIYDLYSTFTCYGGADAPENQFGAIAAAFGTSNIKWSSNSSERSKLVVVITDSGPHHADDGIKPADGTVLEQWAGSFKDDEAEKLCMKTNYPAMQDMFSQIVTNRAYMAFFVFDGDWNEGWAANEWRTFNRYIGQPDVFLRQDTANSSQFWEQLAKVITEIEHVECIQNTTTTTAPTTKTPVLTTVSPQPHTTGECKPTVIVDGECVPSKENCWCHPEVLIELAKRPDKLNLVADSEVIASW